MLINLMFIKTIIENEIRLLKTEFKTTCFEILLSESRASQVLYYEAKFIFLILKYTLRNKATLK